MTPKRVSTIDAGHAPTVTYSHWFTLKNAVSSRSHGLTGKLRVHSRLEAVTDGARRGLIPALGPPRHRAR